LICNHQALVRFRLGAPINQEVTVFLGRIFPPLFAVYPLCTRFRAMRMHDGGETGVDAECFSVDYRYRHVELEQISATLLPDWQQRSRQPR